MYVCGEGVGVSLEGGSTPKISPSPIAEPDLWDPPNIPSLPYPIAQGEEGAGPCPRGASNRQGCGDPGCRVP